MPEDLLTHAPPAPDLRVSYGPDPHQFGELRVAREKPQRALIMNIHGGFWRNRYDLTHAGHFCGALSAAGFTTWNIEYRRVGDEGGGWPGTLEDVRQAWHFIPQLVAENQLAADKVIVTGHSAGGHLALCLAAHEPTVHAVMCLAGVVDLQQAWDLHLSADAVAEFLGGLPEAVREHYRAADPMQLAVPQVTQWLIHGARDDVVPTDFSRRYCERKQSLGEDVHLLEISSADHFDLIDPRSAAWPIVERKIIEIATAAPISVQTKLDSDQR